MSNFGGHVGGTVSGTEWLAPACAQSFAGVLGGKELPDFLEEELTM